MTAALAAFAAAVAAAWIGTRLLLPRLERLGMLDRPNERSSHTRPVPRGAGLAPVLVAAAGWAALAAWQAPALVPVVAGALLLALAGWIDDRRGLTPLAKLAAQAGAVALGLLAGAGSPAALAAAAAVWLWVANATNFMDGIDGLAAGHTVVLAAGAAAVLLAAGDATAAPLAALVLAGAAAGFLPWNWSPARAFLGDAGSQPLGFLAGALLLHLAASGLWAPALLLAGTFLADATSTLALRLARGERVWRPHRRHAYQAAVDAGRSHSRVTSIYLLADAALAAAAVAVALAPSWTSTVLAAALVSAALLLCYLRRVRPHAR